MLIAPPLSLYVHIPWCVKKCPYCDFNSHQSPAQIPEAEYIKALLADLAQDQPQVGKRNINTIFFGGGTPSLFSADGLKRLIDGMREIVSIDAQAEITLEANPGTVEHARFEDYRAAGFNRLSLGVQTFDDAALKRIGRIHGSAEAKSAVKQAQDAGLSNINIDLMYALPEQSQQQALADIDQAIALAPTHISHYQLTLEPNTLFAAKPPKLPDDDAAWAMQEACQARLAELCFAQYEVSAYCRDERYAAHNLNYWMFGDYLGIGAGAHAKITDVENQTISRAWKQKHPRLYLDTANTKNRIGGNEVLRQERLPFEFMLNALRLNSGFNLNDFEARTGLTFTAIESSINQAVERGLLEFKNNHLQATELGQRFLNDLTELFLTD